MKQYMQKFEAKIFAEEIEHAFERYGLHISLKVHNILPDKIIFSLRLKKDTRRIQIENRIQDVQERLHLPLFQLMAEDSYLFIVASEDKPNFPGLGRVLPMLKESKMALPYIIGYDPKDKLLCIDLATAPHLLVGGSTNSGKTVALRALITCIAYTKSSSSVNFILIDVGASDLCLFNELPHLSCPVINEQADAVRALLALDAEMKHRIALQSANAKQFQRLSRLVLLIDEFPALFTGLDKATEKTAIHALSALLQRGRHAKIHVVLAAQNPTLKIMKLDLSNITARMAFRCAKRNFSETILGEGGAERLSGKGDLLFKSATHDLLRAQGIFITSEELTRIVHALACIPPAWDIHQRFVLQKNAQDAYSFLEKPVISGTVVRDAQESLFTETLFAQIVAWALQRSTVSANQIMTQFHLGWNRANRYMAMLEQYGIVECLDAKLPRKVLSSSLKALPADVIRLLKQNGLFPNDPPFAFPTSG